MPLLRNTPSSVGTYALSLSGLSRDRLPVPWTDSKFIDDCARFCSSALWGGKPGPISWVDNFKNAGDGRYERGSADLAPWDVLLFDWEFNGVGNHVEFMIADNGNGTVRTYGANGSDSKAAKFRTRPKRYIMGRFRPAWFTQETVIPTVPIPEEKEIPSMLILDNGKGQAIMTESKFITGINSSTIRSFMKAGVPVAEVTPSEFNLIKVRMNG